MPAVIGGGVVAAHSPVGGGPMAINPPSLSPFFPSSATGGPPYSPLTALGHYGRGHDSSFAAAEMLGQDRPAKEGPGGDARAEFERLTRELQAERQSIARQVEKCHIGSVNTSLSSLNSGVNDAFKRKPEHTASSSSFFSREFPGSLDSSRLVDSCLRTLEEKGHMEGGQWHMGSRGDSMGAADRVPGSMNTPPSWPAQQPLRSGDTSSPGLSNAAFKNGSPLENGVSPYSRVQRVPASTPPWGKPASSPPWESPAKPAASPPWENPAKPVGSPPWESPAKPVEPPYARVNKDRERPAWSNTAVDPGNGTSFRDHEHSYFNNSTSPLRDDLYNSSPPIRGGEAVKVNSRLTFHDNQAYCPDSPPHDLDNGTRGGEDPAALYSKINRLSGAAHQTPFTLSGGQIGSGLTSFSTSNSLAPGPSAPSTSAPWEDVPTSHYSRVTKGNTAENPHSEEYNHEHFYPRIGSENKAVSNHPPALYEEFPQARPNTLPAQFGILRDTPAHNGSHDVLSRAEDPHSSVGPTLAPYLYGMAGNTNPNDSNDNNNNSGHLISSPTKSFSPTLNDSARRIRVENTDSKGYTISGGDHHEDRASSYRGTDDDDADDLYGERRPPVIRPSLQPSPYKAPAGAPHCNQGEEDSLSDKRSSESGNSGFLRARLVPVGMGVENGSPVPLSPWERDVHGRRYYGTGGDYPNYEHLDDRLQSSTRYKSAPYAENENAPYAENNSAPYAENNSAPYAENNSAPYAEIRRSPSGRRLNDPPVRYMGGASSSPLSSPMSTDASHSSSNADQPWRAPDLAEVIELLSHPRDDVRVNAAAYLQHLCYMDDPVKAKTRSLGGIPALIRLLSNDPAVDTLRGDTHRAVCGALLNLSRGYANETIKVDICDAGGIEALVRLLRKTRDSDIKELVSGLLWNLSSAQALKRPIVDIALTVVVNTILIPHVQSIMAAAASNSGVGRQRSSICGIPVLRNATGVLRNVSCEGRHARRKLRECSGLCESLVNLVKCATAEEDIDNKTIENCMCTLRNLCYRLMEVDYPELYDEHPTSAHQSSSANKTQPGRQPSSANDTVGCLPPRKDGRGKDNQYPLPSKTKLGEHKGELLWQTEIVHVFLPLIAECSNPDTLEAAVGAVQNLAACEWEPSAVFREQVRKQKGLPIIVGCLNLEEDRVVRAAATALCNLALDQRSRELIGKYAIAQLVTKLPLTTAEEERGERPPCATSEATLTAIITILYQVVKQSVEYASTLVSTQEGNAIVRLQAIARSHGLYLSTTLRPAHQLLAALWRFSELRGLYKKSHGWKESDFLLKTLHPRSSSGGPNIKGTRSRAARPSIHLAHTRPPIPPPSPPHAQDAAAVGGDNSGYVGDSATNEGLERSFVPLATGTHGQVSGSRVDVSHWSWQGGLHDNQFQSMQHFGESNDGRGYEHTNYASIDELDGVKNGGQRSYRPKQRSPSPISPYGQLMQTRPPFNEGPQATSSKANLNAVSHRLTSSGALANQTEAEPLYAKINKKCANHSSGRLNETAVNSIAFTSPPGHHDAASSYIHGRGSAMELSEVRGDTLYDSRIAPPHSAGSQWDETPPPLPGRLEETDIDAVDSWV